VSDLIKIARENILLTGNITTPEGSIIDKIESQYDCRFIMESCINQKKDASGGWVNSPWLLFYGNKPAHPNGSKWLAFGFSNNGFVVTDGQSIPNHKEGLPGYYNPLTGEIVYSVYRWDNHWDNAKQFAVDGGRDYLKITGKPNYSEFLFGYFHALPDSKKDAKDAGLYFKPNIQE
jgi:hypothetical protein